jgi:hypothetical protein
MLLQKPESQKPYDPGVPQRVPIPLNRQVLGSQHVPCAHCALVTRRQLEQHLFETSHSSAPSMTPLPQVLVYGAKHPVVLLIIFVIA